MDIELFLADLEGRFAEQRRRDSDLLVEELTDAERAGVTLAARLLAVDGPVTLVLRGGRRLDGAVRDCTRTWVLVRGDGGDSLVPLGAVVGAWPLGRVAAGEAGDRADIVTFATAPAHERQQAYSVFSSFGAALSQFSKHLRAEYGPRGVRVHHIESLYTAGSFFTHGNLGADRSTSAHHDVLPDDTEYIEPIGTQHLASEVAFMVSLPAHVNFANAVVQPTRSH